MCFSPFFALKKEDAVARLEMDNGHLHITQKAVKLITNYVKQLLQGERDQPYMSNIIKWDEHFHKK